jgi:hypothetical protein
MEADDDAHEPLSTEGDEDARAHDRDGTVNRVGESLVERNGQGYITEGGHRSLERNGFREWGLGAGGVTGGEGIGETRIPVMVMPEGVGVSDAWVREASVVDGHVESLTLSKAAEGDCIHDGVEVETELGRRAVWSGTLYCAVGRVTESGG